MSTPIPHPPGIPLLGNIFDVDPNNTWWSLKALAEKYGEEPIRVVETKMRRIDRDGQHE